MNKARNFLANAADRLDLPADILAGIPKMEMTGFREFSIEPHHGLVEYERERIRIGTDMGKVLLSGMDMTIKLMNRNRITIKGALHSIQLQEDHL